jgi:integrase
MPTIRKRGNVCQAIVRVKVKGVLVHQESKTFPTEALARSWGLGVEARIKNIGVLARQAESVHLGELITRYSEHLSGLKPLRRSLDHELSWLAAHFRSTKLSTLTSSVFVTFATERSKAGIGPATTLHNLSIVRTVLNSAKAMFGLQVNAEAVTEAMDLLKRIGLIAPAAKREQRVSDEVINALVAEFDRIAAYPQTKLPMSQIVRLAVVFPRRRTELCSMLWANYNAKRGEFLLLDTKHPTKVRNELVPVPPAAAEILDALPRLDARVLPYDPESVSAAFERACARLGISDIRLHDLRHEGISRLFEQGLAIQEVALISGHTSWATLRRYTHLKPNDVVEKMRANSKKA